MAHDACCIEHFTRAREIMDGGIGHNALAGGASDGCHFWPEWSRHLCRNWSGLCLAESKSQQARAQEQDARRCQGKKSVGDYVVVAHETPTTQMLVPNLLKLSESLAGTTTLFLCLKPAVPPNRQAFKPQALER